jgi:hypothetical protein
MKVIQLTKTYDLVVTVNVSVPSDTNERDVAEWLEDYAPAVSVSADPHDVRSLSAHGALITDQSVDSVYPLDTLIIKEQA